MYKAIVCKLTNVRKHSNADRLMLATVQGYQVIVGLEAKDGDLGVFFPCDGQLTKEHLTANKLYSTHPDTGEKMGGYFGRNGRVRAQKLRGEISDGFWQEEKGFNWCGGLTLKNGEEFDTLNGHKICQKYYTPATQRAMSMSKNKKTTNKKENKVVFDFPQHYDTGQLRAHAGAIPDGAFIIISEKLHGSSGRTTRTQKTMEYYKWWNKWLSRLYKFFYKNEEWIYVTGTRRTIRKEGKPGYYGADAFRDEIHNKIKSIGLRKGETLYYEIVGFTETGRSIMPTHKITDKKLKKRYGDLMHYTYGCNHGEYRFYVYRITQKTTDNQIIDLSWDMMLARCKELGLNTVPELDRFILQNKCDLDVHNFLQRINNYTLGDSTLNPNQIKEGVVCKIEHSTIYTKEVNYTPALKYKGFDFCEMEGIKKNDPNYIDLEEIA